MGIEFTKSKYYHSRYEVIVYGRHSIIALQWIRDTFGDEDDMIYASDTDLNYTGYHSLVTEEQMLLIKLKFL